MIKEGRYSISELKAILSESTKQEFKPNIPANVEKDNKENNEKAVKDIEKETKKYDGGERTDDRKARIKARQDVNKGMMDLEFANEPDSTYKDRVKKLAINGALVNDDKEDGGSSTEGNEAIYDSMKSINKEKNKIKKDIKKSGLTAREMDSKNFDANTLFKECKGMKRLNFKNTVFLSEAEVLSKVPDGYKTDGNKFIMKDASGTEYMIECSIDKQFNFADVNIINKFNRTSINEEFDRMKQLYNYTRDENINRTDKSSENNLSNMFRKIREIQK